MKPCGSVVRPGIRMVLFPKDDELTIGDTVPAYIDKAQTWVCYGTIQKG